MSYDDMIPSSIFSFMTKSETRCFPFCGHPGCWQSLEREVRNIPRWMPPVIRPPAHMLTALRDTGLPTITIHDILNQNVDSIDNKEKPPPAPIQIPINYLPALRRIKESEEVGNKHSRIAVETAVYEEEFDDTQILSPRASLKSLPHFYVWVPNSKRTKRKSRKQSDTTPEPIIEESPDTYVRDMTSEVMPKSVEMDRVTKLKKTSRPAGAVEAKPLSPRYLHSQRSPRANTDYDGLQDLLCLPKEVLHSILSSHTSTDLRSKEKVGQILHEHGIFMEMEDKKVLSPKKLPLHEMKDKSAFTYESPKPVFMLDAKQQLELETDRRSRPTCSPYTGSGSTTPIIAHIEEVPMRCHKRNLPPIKVKDKKKVPSIGLGLPTLPGGVHTTRPFSYARKQRLDLALGPVLSAEQMEMKSLKSPYYTDDTQPPSPVEAVKQETDATARPKDTHKHDPLLATHPVENTLGTINEVSATFITEHYTVQPNNRHFTLTGRRFQPQSRLSTSPTSSVSTWPNVQEEPMTSEWRDRTKSGRLLDIVIPNTTDNQPLPPPPSPSPIKRDQSHSSDEQQPQDDNMIVIRSSARSHDSLSMAPMLEEGGESDETMSISACPPDHLDDSSMHVTPVMTSVSPVNGHQHWVKKSDMDKKQGEKSRSFTDIDKDVEGIITTVLTGIEDERRTNDQRLVEIGGVGNIGELSNIGDVSSRGRLSVRGLSIGGGASNGASPDVSTEVSNIGDTGAERVDLTVVTNPALQILDPTNSMNDFASAFVDDIIGESVRVTGVVATDHTMTKVKVKMNKSRESDDLLIQELTRLNSEDREEFYKKQKNIAQKASQESLDTNTHVRWFVDDILTESSQMMDRRAEHVPQGVSPDMSLKEQLGERVYGAVNQLVNTVIRDAYQVISTGALSTLMENSESDAASFTDTQQSTSNTNDIMDSYFKSDALDNITELANVESDKSNLNDKNMKHPDDERDTDGGENDNTNNSNVKSHSGYLNIDKMDRISERSGQCPSRSSNPLVPFNTPRGSVKAETPDVAEKVQKYYV